MKINTILVFDHSHSPIDGKQYDLALLFLVKRLRSAAQSLGLKFRWISSLCSDVNELKDSCYEVVDCGDTHKAKKIDPSGDEVYLLVFHPDIKDVPSKWAECPPILVGIRVSTEGRRGNPNLILANDKPLLELCPEFQSDVMSASSWEAILGAVTEPETAKGVVAGKVGESIFPYFSFFSPTCLRATLVLCQGYLTAWQAHQHLSENKQYFLDPSVLARLGWQNISDEHMVILADKEKEVESSNWWQCLGSEDFRARFNNELVSLGHTPSDNLMALHPDNFTGVFSFEHATDISKIYIELCGLVDLNKI